MVLVDCITSDRSSSLVLSLASQVIWYSSCRLWQSKNLNWHGNQMINVCSSNLYNQSKYQSSYGESNGQLRTVHCENLMVPWLCFVCPPPCIFWSHFSEFIKGTVSGLYNSQVPTYFNRLWVDSSLFVAWGHTLDKPNKPLMTFNRC